MIKAQDGVVDIEPWIKHYRQLDWHYQAYPTFRARFEAMVKVCRVSCPHKSMPSQQGRDLIDHY